MTKSPGNGERTPCEACVAWRTTARMVAALPIRLIAFVLLVAGMALVWTANLVDPS